MSMAQLPPLVEVDSLQAVVIIDNELDPMSPPAPDTVQVSGNMAHIAFGISPKLQEEERGGASVELKMEDICCSAHGLSIMVTATKGDISHTVLFDVGPEEAAWERNARRLKAEIARVEVIQLSHWHRDHSGGMLKAIQMIKAAQKEAQESNPSQSTGVTVDLHPARPDYRGFGIGEKIVSLEADPSFLEMEAAGATVQKSENAHTVLDDMFLISDEIPRQTAYETGLKFGMRYDAQDKEWFTDEKIADERFLMCNVKGKGLVMFTGCSHAGVVNAARHARTLSGGSVPFHAIVGGYHLAGSDEQQIESTVRDLKDLEPDVLIPGHCTGWRAKFAIEKRMPGQMVPCTVGSKITF